jgi:hypothetical protein
MAIVAMVLNVSAIDERDVSVAAVGRECGIV